MRRQLIINADDLGLTRAITDGIFRAHEAGVLTSASLMVNQDCSEYAMSRLSDFPRLGVGVHLNICEGHPILPPSKVPTLVQNNGHFLPAGEMQRRLNSCRVSSSEIEAEFRAQIREARLHGIRLSHADSHCHMHQFFGAVVPFRRALAAEEIPWIRSSRIRHWPYRGRLGGPHNGNVARRLAVSMYMEFLSKVVLRQFSSPDCRIENYPRRIENDSESMLQSWRETFDSVNQDGVFELVCHPAYPDPERVMKDRIHNKRVAELELLTCNQFRELLVSRGFTLISYATLAGSHAIKL